MSLAIDRAGGVGASRRRLSLDDGIDSCLSTAVPDDRHTALPHSYIRHCRTDFHYTARRMVFYTAMP